MSNPSEERGVVDGLASPLRQSIRAMRTDLSQLHAAWMELLFGEGLRADHSIVEVRHLDSSRAAAFHKLWAWIGVLVVAVWYPLVVVGLATRFYSRRIDRWTASLGFLGVLLVSMLGWGILTLATYLGPITFEGVIAVAIASLVATVSAVLALYFTRRERRFWTVALGYPFGMTGLFLPPVVAALYSPTLAAIIFPRSESLAIWLLDTFLARIGLASIIRASFELEGLAYVAMWFGIAVPLGWVLGGLVTLASRARARRASPRPAEHDAGFVWPDQD